ncbi:PREDICTED: protein AHNAK2-like, partial [Acanthisitta chloris]|uniref:protein AHNAK2-like n=1 Tax=Acanthisitta chloris TaxID=57068 RepID=UPI0004F0CCE8
MEVTLKTEVEAGASGFSVKGGGNEGIFIKRVLKESPASKIFSLKEGDQLLSTTIFFDNIKYEDALKILQYSEPYRVQFSLKRKIAVKEDLEDSAAQSKKERISQEKELSESNPEESLRVSGKAIAEEDMETLIASQRVGRSKRPKKERLSWPKFQSIKTKKILRHRRSHSTSDAYEPALQDISPTSTDTESQFPPEVHTKEKKGSQKKLKFPSIGFKMHRAKAEPQDKQKKEVKSTLISEREKIHEEDVSLENPEILTVEYTTSPAYEMKAGEVHETLTKDFKEMKNGIPSRAKQRPEVEISIQKEKDKESTSKLRILEEPDRATQMPKPSLETPDLKESPTKKPPQASSKSRKKKQKGTADKKEGEGGIAIEVTDHTAKGSVQASADLQAPEAALSLEGEAKAPEKEAAKTKDGKFKMPKFGMPSFGWSSSREAKGTVAAEQDISVKEPQVTLPSGSAEADVTLPGAEIQAPSVEVSVETGAAGEGEKAGFKMPDIKLPSEGEKGGFKMPDVKLPSVKLSKGKAPQVQVSLPTAEISLPKGPEGDVALHGPETEGSLEVSAGKAQGGGMKIQMPKVKVPSVVFSKPTVKAPKQDTEIDTSLPQVDLNSSSADITITAPDIKVPCVEGSLKVQVPEGDVKAPSIEASLDGAELETTGLKEKLKMPKFDKPKFRISSPKAEGAGGEVSLPSTEIDLRSTSMMDTGEGFQADIHGTNMEGAGLKLEKPSLEMPKADIKAPKVDITLPSIDITLPKGSANLQALETTLTFEGEAKVPEKETTKTKDGKFKMPKFGMPSFGWSSSREAKGTVAPELDVSVKEPQVTLPLGSAEVDVTLPEAEIQVPGVEVTIETGAADECDKGGFKMPDVKLPSVKLSKVKAPQGQASLPSAEVSLPKGPEADVALQGPEAGSNLEVSAGKEEGGGMKIHMPKVKVPSVVFSKPTVTAPKLDTDVSLQKADTSLPKVDLKADR